MEKSKTKKDLKELISSSFQEAIQKAELPSPSKKINKLLNKNAKKLAGIFHAQLKHESKKKEKADKALTYVADVLKGKEKVKKSKVAKVVADIKK